MSRGQYGSEFDLQVTTTKRIYSQLWSLQLCAGWDLNRRPDFIQSDTNPEDDYRDLVPYSKEEEDIPYIIPLWISTPMTIDIEEELTRPVSSQQNLQESDNMDLETSDSEQDRPKEW
mgnify:CR=1 FL=1